ncbi:MAG: DUF4197 domain-containing protein [Pedobacter sp.]
MVRLKNLLIGGVCVLGVVFFMQNAHAGFQDFFKGVQDVFTGSASLTDGDIAAGLKEALQIGTGNAVANVGKVGGYLDNPQIRIPLPGPLEKSENLLRLAGYGSQVDAFSQSINRAAEVAAPQAKELFWQAIREMSIEDARQILGGGDTAATTYFKEKTSGNLREIFKPIIHDSMAKVGATRYFQDLDAKVKAIPFAGSLNLDLDSYVTDGALNGLFTVVAEEERKIRQNPAARTTDLLKKVFSAGG